MSGPYFELLHEAVVGLSRHRLEDLYRSLPGRNREAFVFGLIALVCERNGLPPLYRWAASAEVTDA